MKRVFLLLAVLVLSLSAPGAAMAGRTSSVDPALMQPPLNPGFAPWECWRTGDGIICEGARRLSWEAVETGLICDGRMVYTNETDNRWLRRYGDANGLALKSTQHVDIRAILSLNADMSGPTLRGAGHFQEHYAYPIPGNISSRTDKYSGLDVRVTGPGVGLVVHDVGVKVFDIEDNVLFARGPHPIVDDFEGAVAKLCDAFAELGA